MKRFENMNNRKYPLELFIFGFINNILFHFFWLFVPAVILLIVGIFVKSCLYIGLVLLAADVVLSFVEQMMIRNAFLAESDNPDFRAFQDAISREGNWRDNLGQLMDELMVKPEDEVKPDSEESDEENSK